MRIPCIAFKTNTTAPPLRVTYKHAVANCVSTLIYGKIGDLVAILEFRIWGVEFRVIQPCKRISFTFGKSASRRVSFALHHTHTLSHIRNRSDYRTRNLCKGCVLSQHR